MTEQSAVKNRVSRALAAGRRWTFRLLDPVADEALHRQHDPIMSPLVWDMGHIGNFEELWLLRGLGQRDCHDPDLDRVYNPFDNPRAARADLPILERPDATTYLADVRSQALRVLSRTELDPTEPLVAGGFVYDLVVQHEAQHQETMLQTIDLRTDWGGGTRGADRRQRLYLPATGRRLPPCPTVDDTERRLVPAGPFAMGAAAVPAAGSEAARLAATTAYDNERPRHTVHVPAFALDRFPASARRYAAFIDAGGYDDPRWWSARGWRWRCDTGRTAPQGWLPGPGGQWQVRRFNRVQPLDPREIVEHVSCFEAEAFARWAGGRLPTEAEWEKAAAHDPATGTSRPFPWGDAAPAPRHANLDRRHWGPTRVGSYPAGASAYGVEQLLGDTYEWTSSPFGPYPGYATFPYPEYSEVFFGGDWRVLRGASWASRAAVARTTFRNWDHPYRRQIFAGVRVAYDAVA